MTASASTIAAPLPAYLSLLALALPGVYLTGLAAARRVSEGALSHALAPALGLASWLLTVHAASLLTQSFAAGLSLGTLITGAAAPFIRRTNSADGCSTRSLSWIRIVLVCAVTAPVVWISFGWDFHDENIYTGHRSITAQIQNGAYPPRHLSFPALELGYHYGFNLLSASIATIFRLAPAQAIDVASVGLWFLTAWLLGALGDRWLDAGKGWLAIVVVLFAGGVPFCLWGGPHDIGDTLGLCRIDGQDIVPPLISTFFQHPWAIGYPLALATWLVFTDGRLGFARHGALSLLLLTLAFSQVVLFAALLASLGLCELWNLWRTRRAPRELVQLLAFGTAVAVGALLLGGFFRNVPWQAASPMEFNMGISAKHLSLWHFQSFGAILPLGVVGLFALPVRARLPLVLFTTLCMGALNLVDYRFSHDEVKFGAAAMISLGIGAAAAVHWIGQQVRGLILGLSLAVAIMGGLAFTAAFSLLPSRASLYFNMDNTPPGPDDAQAIEFLRGKVRQAELVYRRPAKSYPYVLLGGLPTVWIDWGVNGFGFPAQWIQRRAHLLLRQPANSKEWIDQGVVWFVIEEQDARLSSLATTWIDTGVAVQAAQFGSLRIVGLRVP